MNENALIKEAPERSVLLLTVQGPKKTAAVCDSEESSPQSSSVQVS